MELSLIRFSPRECMEDAAGTLAVNAQQKGLRLMSEVSPDIPDVVVGDPVRLRQVLLNLLNNAVKFTKAGSVEMRAELYERRETALTLHFSVCDTGMGIPADKTESIFEAFRQADGSITRSYGGTRLGLTICARLVSMMGGRIWVDSEPGAGSIFHFTAVLRDGTEKPRGLSSTHRLLTRLDRLGFQWPKISLPTRADVRMRALRWVGRRHDACG